VDRAARPPAFVIDFRSSRSRLGQYLLVNSDGEAWLPDERGRTLRLGCVFGREGAVLTPWREAVAACLARGQAVPSRPPVISVAGREMLFISYAREDRRLAAKLADELDAEGVDCLIDPELAEGDPFWRERIARHFPDCSLMVGIASTHARNSPWVEQEQRAFPGRS